MVRTFALIDKEMAVNNDVIFGFAEVIKYCELLSIRTSKKGTFIKAEYIRKN